MKRTFFLLLALFAAVNLFAQNNINVVSFRPLENDLTANTNGTKKVDQNGVTAALIKLQTTQTGFTFDGGSLGIVGSVQKPGEIWVYVPEKLQRITIQHAHLGVLRDYPIPISIESGRTYEMVLTTGKVQTIVQDAITQQWLVVTTEPKDATVFINNEFWDNTEGTAQKFVDFGKYTYTVSAPLYHDEAGIIEVKDPEKSVLLPVRLKPAYGFLKIDAEGEAVGATVLIDGEKVGITPYTSDKLKSGQHKIIISKPMYKTYESTFIVPDSATVKVDGNLAPNFSNTTIEVDADAEIWINGEKKGVRTWSGKLPAGNYRFECKQENHRPTTMTKELTAEGVSKSTITLTPPTPIVGKLNISSVPAGGIISIDGKEYGTTPRLIQELLIGSHQVSVTKAGYGSFSQGIDIKEGATSTLSAELGTVKKVTFTANRTGSTLYLDGRSIGLSPQTLEVKFGTHLIKAENAPYAGEQTIIVNNESSVTFNISMRIPPVNYVKKKYGYIDAVYQVGGLTGAGGSFGYYLNNHNAQVDFTYGLSTSEPLYWYDSDSKLAGTSDYLAYRLALRYGYGMRAGNRFQFTPQIGIGMVALNPVNETINSGLNIGKGASTVVGLVSFRTSLNVAKWCRLVVTPEYSLSLSKSKVYELFSANGSEIKSMSDGFNVSVGIGICF